MEDLMQIINNAVALLKERGADKATIGLILGSGLGDYAETLENKRFVNYADIEDYPVSAVVGHKNRFVIGEKNGKTFAFVVMIENGGSGSGQAGYAAAEVMQKAFDLCG